VNEAVYARPSLPTVQAELRRYLIGFAVVLSDLYGPHALRGVLNAPPTVADPDVIDRADVSSLSLCALLADAYDYAFGGRLSSEMEQEVSGAPSYFDQIADLLQFTESSLMFETIFSDTYLLGDHVPNGGLRRLADTGRARARLDDGDPLTAKDIALLACIAERSVQNAFSVKGRGRLNAEKSSGSSWVTADDARRWLADKKGFVPTRALQFDAADPLPETIDSLAELRALLRSRMEARFGGDLARFAAAIRLSEFEVSRKLTGGAPFQLSDALPIAHALSLDDRWLVTQIFRVTHPREAALLLPAQV